MLLTNDLTNICSEITQIRLIYEWLTLARFEGVENSGRNECVLHR